MKDKKSREYKRGDNKTDYVEEAPTSYYISNKSTPLSAMTPFEKMQIIKEGISKRYLELFKKAASLDYYSLADALSVTRATLINKKGSEKFNDQVSERIVSLADLYSYGYEVFENHEHFNSWMFAPNQALGGRVPFDLIDNQYGREEIRNIIGRIAYGVHS